MKTCDHQWQKFIKPPYWWLLAHEGPGLESVQREKTPNKNVNQQTSSFKFHNLISSEGILSLWARKSWTCCTVCNLLKQAVLAKYFLGVVVLLDEFKKFPSWLPPSERPPVKGRNTQQTWIKLQTILTIIKTKYKTCKCLTNNDCYSLALTS